MDILSFPGLDLEFHLKKTAFTVFGIEIQWYAIMISLGVALAFIYITKNSRKFGLHPDTVLDCILVGIIGGIVGARLYYVIFQWNQYKNNLLDIFNTRKGGLAIYGGVIGGLLAGYLMSKRKKIKFLPLFDLAGLGLLIGQSIGRWGNFFNIETFGSNTTLPWGMTSETIRSYLSSVQSSLAAEGVTVHPNLPVHPCFLYESIWCALGFFLLNAYKKKRKFDGEIFLMYLGWYGIGRFFIEGLRTDSLMIGPVRISQLLSAVLAVASICVIIIIRMKMKQSSDSNYLALYVTTDESKELIKKTDDILSEKSNKKHDKKIAVETQDEYDDDISDDEFLDDEEGDDISDDEFLDEYDEDDKMQDNKDLE